MGYKPITPTLRRLRQEDQEFKANMSYNSKPFLKTKQQKINTTKYSDPHKTYLPCQNTEAPDSEQGHSKHCEQVQGSMKALGRSQPILGRGNGRMVDIPGNLCQSAGWRHEQRTSQAKQSGLKARASTWEAGKSTKPTLTT